MLNNVITGIIIFGCVGVFLSLVGMIWYGFLIPMIANGIGNVEALVISLVVSGIMVITGFILFAIVDSNNEVKE